MNQQHMTLSITNEHYTPEPIVESARRVLGEIDLDPASCTVANERVRAARWFGVDDDGLSLPWAGRVFLNPPGGRTPAKWRDVYETRSSATAWWRRLVSEYTLCKVDAAIFVGFNLEILRTSQGGRWPSALRYPFCVPRERLCFGGDDPTHANAIMYLGPDVEVFEREFSVIGEVRR